MMTVFLTLTAVVLVVLLRWGLREVLEYLEWVSLCKELERTNAARDHARRAAPPE